MKQEIDLLDPNIIGADYVWLSTTWSDLILVTIGLLLRVVYTYYVAHERVSKRPGVLFDYRVMLRENKLRWIVSACLAYALIFAAPEFLYDKFGYNWDTLLSLALGFLSVAILKYVLPKGDTVIRDYAEKGIRYDEKIHSNK